MRQARRRQSANARRARPGGAEARGAQQVGAAAATVTQKVSIGDSYLALMDEQLARQCMVVLVEGRRGTSKTRSILTILLARLLQHPGARCALWRSTRVLLGSTVLRTLEEQVFPAFGLAVPGGVISPVNRTEYRLPNGSAFVPRGLDTIAREQSAEYAWGYPAEITELPDEQTITALLGSLRQVVHRADGRPAFPHQLICDANPTYPQHFANRLAQPAGDHLRRIETREDYLRTLDFNLRHLPAEGQWKRIITTHCDNPGYWDHARWEWTEVGRDYYERNLSMLRGHLESRWKYGLWVAADGAVFPEFSAARHVVVPFDVEDWPVYMFWDPGANHPTAVLWIARAPNGCLYVVDEIYQGGRTVAQHCEEILRRERAWVEAERGLNVQGRYADPQYAFSKTAQSIKTIAEQAEECGIHLERWPATGNTANELQMIEAMRGRLAAQGIKVFGSCQATINEFQSWMWRRRRDGTDGDEPEDRNNDCLDCIKGAVALRIHDLKPRYTLSAAAGSPAAVAAAEQWQVGQGRRREGMPQAPRRETVGGV